VYEIVDGDMNSQRRTTGDVAFNLSAVSEKHSVYLFYDSILSIDSNRNVISSEVRLASRNSVYPEDWRYTILDGTSINNTIAGFSVDVKKYGGEVIVAWIAKKDFASANSGDIYAYNITLNRIVSQISESEFGSPRRTVHLGKDLVYFDCSSRICKYSLINGEIQLLSGAINKREYSNLVQFKSSGTVYTIINGKVKSIQSP